MKFGPTVAVFCGEAKLAYDHSARRCTIQGCGIDGRGASRANASGTVEATVEAKIAPFQRELCCWLTLQKGLCASCRLLLTNAPAAMELSVRQVDLQKTRN